MMNQKVYQAAFRSSPAMMLILDDNGGIVQGNQSFEKTLDYDMSQSSGLTIQDICHSRDVDDIRHRLRDLTEGRQAFYRGTVRFVTAGKEVVWVDVMAAPILKGPQAGLGVMVMALNALRQNGLQSVLDNKNLEYETLFEKEGTAVMVIDGDMAILRINDLLEKISGYSKGDFGHNFQLSDYVHPDDLDKLVRYHKARRKNPDSVPQSYPCRLVHKDGRIKEYTLTVTIIPNTNKSMISFRDTLPKTLVQPVKTSSDQMFRLMAENSSDQVFIADLEVNITYVSPSVEKMSGYTQEEFKLLSPSEYFTPASYQKARKKIKQGLDGRYDITQPFLTEYEIIHKDGSLKWIETLVQFVVDEYGKPLGLTGASRDITKKKRAEEALKAGEAKYRLLTEGLRDVVFVVLPDLTIDYISPVVYEITGYDPQEILGGGIEKYFADLAELETAMQLFDEILRTKRPTTNHEFLLIAKDRDPLYIELTAQPIIKDDEVVMVQCVARDISDRKKEEERLKKREESLCIENQNLRKSIQQSGRFGNIIGRSRAMMDIYDLLLMAAPTNLHTVINGESGTGKELIARAIHDLSNRDKEKFVPVNCGAIPESIIESEFFGCRKGAFTGATQDRSGYLDLADGGTLFLDEIGEIGLNMQVKLLRAIEGGGYTPVGTNRMKTADIRIVAATNRNMEELVKQGKMRSDFYFRINIIRVDLPPLRDRCEDIPILVDHFLRQCKHNKDVTRLPDDVMAVLRNHAWPGNVRELQNVVNQYVALKRIDFSIVGEKTPESSVAAISEPDQAMLDKAGTLASMVQDYERKIIYKNLVDCEWNKSRVAKNLNIDRKTLSAKIRKYDLVPESGE